MRSTLRHPVDIMCTVLAATLLLAVAPGCTATATEMVEATDASDTAGAAASAAPTAVDDGILFTFEHASARTVHLAGEFNGWDPAALAMRDDDGNGVWEVVLDLQAGRTWQYKYVVDGGTSWEPDPHNPEKTDDGHGGYNSVLSVADDGSVVMGAVEGSDVHEPIVGTLESYGRPINLAVIWHQHQPKYLKDLETGEYMEPWVRLHAIKDYYDMVSILDGYPGIHFTVNLTPILLMQLEDLIASLDAGVPCDEYYRMTLKDASALTVEDQVYLLTHFFNAHWDNMILVWPRYAELKAMKGGDSLEELEAAAAGFSEQDWRDLQVWFNLAWFDPDFQDGDVELEDGRVVTVRHLIEKERGYSEDDKVEILEAQRAIMENVVAVHRRLQDAGQIEVTTTPFYHPILPLIHDTDLARVAMPGTALPAERFARREDVTRHLELAVEYYAERFGHDPKGLWPGEGSVAQEIVPAVASAGLLWMASDDQVLQKTLGTTPTVRQKYSMHWAGEEGARVAMIFRDHRLSDDIGFNFSRLDGVEAANAMMRSLHSIHRQLAGDDRGYVVPIILDGENAWEWFENDGKEFFHSWYGQMEQAEWLNTVTVAEYLEANQPTETLPKLWAGSWISHNFATWIGESEENTAWEYLAKVRNHLEARERSGEIDGPTLERAYDEMLAAEGSDWFWWYGDDQTSSLEGAFDEIYRKTLSHVYEILGDPVPEFLSVPVLEGSPGTGGGGTMARADSRDDAELLAGPVLVEGGVLFSTRDDLGATVHLAGDFNGWSTDATPMTDEDGDNIWTVIIELEPGTYQYKFVSDGGARWFEDEGNPEFVSDPYGGRNSVVVVE